MLIFSVILGLLTSKLCVCAACDPRPFVDGILQSSYYTVLFILVEDILWFVFNQYFTLKKYDKDSIWWHSKQPWIFGIPLHNFIGVGYLTIVSWILSSYYLFIGILISFAFIYCCELLSHRYHKFYMSVHKKCCDLDVKVKSYDGELLKTS